MFYVSVLFMFTLYLFCSDCLHL